jgi:hypothetical protein
MYARILYACHLVCCNLLAAPCLSYYCVCALAKIPAYSALIFKWLPLQAYSVHRISTHNLLLIWVQQLLILVLIMNRVCKNHPDRFCYICGQVTFPQRKLHISEFVRKAYHAYFGVKLGDQDKAFAPHFCCQTCVNNLRSWWNKSKECLPFAVPMVWREGKDHSTDCYFCMVNLEGKLRKL